VSPVLDSAAEVLVVDTGAEPPERSVHTLGETYMPQRVERLQDMDVDVVICGAVSNPLRRMIESAGITVIPWTRGPVDGVLEAYLSGSLQDGPEAETYAMPGRRGGRGPRYRGGRGHHRNCNGSQP
jgi:predicted Fe-Mo cluster-binding NifX family protein